MPSEDSSLAAAPRNRLPTDVVPSHYDLTIHTDLENATFNGRLSDISLQVADRQDTCMALESASDSLADRGIIVFPEELPEDSDARLTINFKGRLTRSLRGYYMAVGGKDGKVVYSLTQFQPTSARRAFPCWDEPALKATFTITMLSKVDSVNLSNMMVKSEKACNTPDALKDDPWLTMKAGTLDDQSQWKITRFETTPPISTYLVAYANGPFKYLESSYKSPLSGKVRPLRIYAMDDIIGQGHYTLEIAQKVMPLYEDVFDVEYPLPKLDFLTSSNFDLGSIFVIYQLSDVSLIPLARTQGLITGKTTCFLDNPNTNDVRHQLYVACTTSHEISHMWFGDITTMEWWDMLYLNEGFATLVGEIMILDRAFPDWRLDAQFLGWNYYPARALDAKLSSHPIEVDCPDESKIIQVGSLHRTQTHFTRHSDILATQLFDDLSYNKAAAVLRMLSTYVGEEMFLKGVSLYLKKHKYKNTVTSHLWEAIQSVTNRDIAGMMDNWIKKASDDAALSMCRPSAFRS
ncbi:hypothetical protein NUW54_g7816 [Trametes sanguinea]|uniref:Uncharacterized protein n=1 Tax=Trametes sanguinea TaxID=158606 RepID=A0ACC1PJB8_9APHY|nr:hypothetical protein NUW54_g7816 [Trametes sanguinea]